MTDDDIERAAQIAALRSLVADLMVGLIRQPGGLEQFREHSRNDALNANMEGIDPAFATKFYGARGDFIDDIVALAIKRRDKVFGPK